VRRRRRPCEGKRLWGSRSPLTFRWLRKFADPHFPASLNLIHRRPLSRWRSSWRALLGLLKLVMSALGGRPPRKTRLFPAVGRSYYLRTNPRVLLSQQERPSSHVIFPNSAALGPAGNQPSGHFHDGVPHSL
jgi:hypothetical protein